MTETIFDDGCAVIRAGGDGTRLRAITDNVAGGPRPKQLCALLGPEPLLTQTRRRVEHLVLSDRTLIVVTQPHERFYSPLLSDAPPLSIVVQPANRGTASAILHGLLRLRSRFDDAPVAVFPSDHYVDSDAEFMNHVRVAFDAVRRLNRAVVLLGAEPTSAETGYGWIEPGDTIDLSPLHHVRKFWEKPSAVVADALLRGGCLWNTFVMISRVSTLLLLMAGAVPDVYRKFERISESFGTSRERESIAHLYEQIGSTNFSDRVLTLRADSLSVLPTSRVEWSDVGEVERLRQVLDRRGRASVSKARSPLAADFRSGRLALTSDPMAVSRNRVR